MRDRLLCQLLAIAVCLSIAGTSWSAPRLVYVDAAATGANDGSSWADAYVYLQDALAEAAPAAKPIEIRVAQGVYTPDRGIGITSGDRDATFQLVDGVTLKGGYGGVDALDPDDHDPRRYETILSGDLSTDDVEVGDLGQLGYEPTRTDNTVHIVSGSGTDATAVLEGFTVTAARGAGMYNDAGSPTVRHCVFRSNLASIQSGAVYNRDGSPLFSHCTFKHNGPYRGRGAGAMYNDNAAPEIISCTFSGNVAEEGAGMLNKWHSRPLLKDCVFENNVSENGGAIYNRPDCAVELYRCTFERNRAVPERVGATARGGAVVNEGGELIVAQCTFRKNSANHEAGAIDALGGILRLSECTFTDNRANFEEPFGGARGGALNCVDCTATLTGCMFERNTASRGGAVYVGGQCHVTMTACRFVENAAFMTEDILFSGRGGALLSDSAWVRLADCTFGWNRAFDGGGAVYSLQDKILAADRCVFMGNRAENGGGGLCINGSGYAADDADFPLTHCLFSGNRAPRGGAVYAGYDDGLIIHNCTFASNKAEDGAAVAAKGRAGHKAVLDLAHCIIRDGPGFLWNDEDVEVTVRFSNVQGSYSGQGNVDVDPLFVRPGYWADADDPNAVWVDGDYHLQSQAGRWDKAVQAWIRDETTSPCVDLGHLAYSYGLEPFPNGGTLNLGAYGGTAEASKSYFGEPVCDAPIAGDINGDCKVDFADFELMAYNWLRSQPPVSNQPPTVVIAEPADGAVVEVSALNPSVLITADAADPDGVVKQVRFVAEYRDRTRLFRTGYFDQDGSDGWQWPWNWWDRHDQYPEGQYTICAYVTDDDGAMTISPAIMITLHPAD